MPDILYHNAQLKVEVFSYIGPPDSGKPQNDKVIIRDLSDIIINFSYTKGLERPDGSFELLLKASGQDMRWSVHSGDWIVIKYIYSDPMQKNQNFEKTRVIGFIDRISRSTNILSNGEIDMSYKISGRDIGKIFSDMIIFIDRYSLGNKHAGEIGTAVQAFLEGEAKGWFGSPSTVIKKILYYFLGNHPKKWPSTLKQYLVPSALISRIIKHENIADLNNQIFLDAKVDKTTFRDSVLSLLKLDIQTLKGAADQSQLLFSALNTQMPFWGILEACQNSEVNEMFIEINNNNIPTFYLRPIPFLDEVNTKNLDANIKKSFPQLFYRSDINTVLVSSSLIINTDLGASDHDRYNYFLLLQDVGSDLGIFPLLNFPKLNEISIQRYGMRPYFKTISYTYLTNLTEKGKEGKTNLELLEGFNNFLYTILNNNPYYENGTITLMGNPNIKIGSNLNIDYNGKIYSYYVESYTDNFVIDQTGKRHFTTTALVTRGYNKSDKSFISVYTYDQRSQIGTSLNKR